MGVTPRTLARHALRRAGWYVSREPQGWTASDLEMLERPTTVIDVGAADGTPQLYTAFPEACHVAVEPLVEFTETLHRLLPGPRPLVVTAACGSTHGGETMLQVRPDAPLMTSAFPRTTLTDPGGDVEERTVAVTTVDEVVQRHGLQGPFVLKVDVEGGELAVLEGASTTLRHTLGVVAELSVAQRFEGSYRYSEVIARLASHGFELSHVPYVYRRGNQTVLMDTVFRPVTSSAT